MLLSVSHQILSLRIVEYELLNLLLHSLLYTFKREHKHPACTLHPIKRLSRLLFGAQQHASSAVGVHSPVENAVQ